MPSRKTAPAAPTAEVRRGRRGSRQGARIGLALAGGGPLGAIYEIGALCALEEAIDGLDLTRCDGYIGVSAGGFVAAGLVNGLSPRQLCAAFIENSPDAPFNFDPSLLLRPAWGEYSERLSKLPMLLAQALWQTSTQGRSLLGAFERLGRALPAGLLSGEPIAAHIHALFSQDGRSDDFRQLARPLILVATDLDSGQAVPFGAPGWDHVPISRAVQASSALPGLFPPVEIEGRHYVDGALKKTLHASVLLDQGLDLLLCLNPLVPYVAGHDAHARIPRLVDGGLPVVLSQTLRSLIHSRLELGMRRYARSHPDTDIALFEPDPRDAEMFLANTFSYSQRRHLAEHAYQATRHQLMRRHSALQTQFASHGLTLRLDVLLDTHRRLLDPMPGLPGPDRDRTLPRAERLSHAMQRLARSLTVLEARQAA